MKVIGYVLLFLVISVVAFAQQTSTNDSFPRGQVIEVTAKSDPKQSYALYLPSQYTPDKKWPILYCLDPSENGKEPADLFRESAEKYGYILACTNNFRSDDSSAPGIQAINTLWKDTHDRFSIQEERIYATGFSGGARMSCDIGMQKKGVVAGVIGCGAGFPPDHPPSGDISFAYFATIGNTDFNYFELRNVANVLEGTTVPYKIEVFDGTHQWPPASLCTEAIEWMEVRAMKDGKKEKDAALIDALYAKSMEKAKSQESSGHLLAARDEYRSIQRDFEGLHDTASATQKLNELKDSPALAKEVEWQKQWDQKAQEVTMKLRSVTKSIRDTSRPVPNAETVSAFLGLDDLKKEAASGATPEDRTAAKSVLHEIYVNNIFYLPRDFIQVGDYQRALLCYNIAGMAKENDPNAWYNKAALYAQMGDKKNAVDALKKAVDFGFTNAKYLEEDADFNSMHDDKDYQKLIDTIRKNGEKPKS